MVKKSAVPDAWDDDWESQADKTDQEPVVQEDIPRTTKAERLAQHAETNKKLWQSAEEPETFHYLAARPPVPLKTEFKPTLRVLARKPQPTVIRRIDPVTGLEKLTLDEGEEEVVEQKKQLSVEEQRAKSAKEREEKQKRYDEARARILGTGSAGGGSGSSTPGTVTPPTGTEGGRGKGRNRGGGVGIASPEIKRPESQSGNKELYDPNYTPKPGATSLQSKRNGGEQSRSGRSTPREDDQVIRAPKGPDGSGRGFGFAQRGGKTS